MPVFQFKTPEGSIFEFDAPDQASALDAFHRNVRPAPQKSAPLPPGFVLDPPPVPSPTAHENQPRPAAPGPWEKYAPKKAPPIPPGFVLQPRKSAPLPPGFTVTHVPGAPSKSAPLPPSFVLDRPGQPDPSLDLPVPDGQGGINAAYSPQDRGTPTPTSRAPSNDPMRALDIGFQGMRQGAAELAGFPVDMSNALLSLGAIGLDALPVIPDVPWRPNPKPFGGSAQLTDTVEAVMPGEPFSYGEMTDAQRLGFEANRFGTQSLIPSGILSNPAVRNAVGKLAPAVAPHVEQLSRPYSQGASIIGDTIAGAGAGVGYGAYDMYTPEPIKKMAGPLGEVISSMGGAVGAHLLQNLAETGTMAIAGAGRKSLGGDYDTSLPQNPDGSFVTTRDADRAAMFVQDKAADPRNAANTLSVRADELRGKGTLPTSGLLSDDPGLVNYERAARLDPDHFNDFALNQRGVETSALANARQIAPETAVGRQFTDTVENGQGQRVDLAQRRVDWTERHAAGVDERNMQLAAEATAARGGRVSASERLDPVVSSRLTDDQARKNQAFAAIDPQGEVQRPIDPLVERVNAIEANAGVLNDPANQPRGIMDRIKKQSPESISPEDALTMSPEQLPTGMISFKDLNAARPELASQIAVARKAGNYSLADNLSSIKRTIDDEAIRLADEGGDVGTRARAAMEEYARFAQVWNKGPGDAATGFRKDFNLDRNNRTITAPSQTAERFLQPGQPEKAASLKRILEGNPRGDEGRKSIGDYLAADLAEAPGIVRPNGVLNPKAIENWVAKWGGESLDLAPDFRNQLNGMLIKASQGQSDSSQLAAQLKDANRLLREAQTNTGAIARVLGKDPASAVAGILASGDSEATMRQIVQSIAGNDNARNGLKASVREYLMERATTSAVQKTSTGENPLSFAKLDDVFKQHENALAEVFTPDEMHSLRVAHQFLAPMKNLEMRTVVGSQTSAHERMWERLSKPMEVALKMRYGVLKGGGVMRTMNVWRQMLPDGDAGAKQLIARMWFDPDLAKHLLTRNVEQIGTSGYNAKLIKLLSAGAAAREINSWGRALGSGPTEERAD